MVRWVGSVTLLLNPDCPRTRSALGKFAGDWSKGFGKRSTRPLPVSATNRLPTASSAKPIGRYRLWALGLDASLVG